MSVVAQTGVNIAGLYYPVMVAAITFGVVGSPLLRQSRGVKIWRQVGGAN